MRKKRCEIKKRSAIDSILNRCSIGRMATIGGDGFPYIVPVNYVYLDGSVYFHCSSSGEKLENIRRDSKVCFEVDIPLAYLDLDYYGEIPEPCMVHQFYHCVIIRGRAEFVDDIGEKLRALNALVAHHEPDGRAFVPVDKDTKAVSFCEVIAIRIVSVSGKSDLAQKKDAGEKKKLSEFFRNRGLPGDEEAAEMIAQGGWQEKHST